MIETGMYHHFLVPSLIDGLTISLNISPTGESS